MSSDDFSDREEIRAIIAAQEDKKKPRSALFRGRFGIMQVEVPLRKPRKVIIINGKIKLVRD